MYQIKLLDYTRNSCPSSWLQSQSKTATNFNIELHIMTNFNKQKQKQTPVDFQSPSRTGYILPTKLVVSTIIIILKPKTQEQVSDLVN